MRLSVKKRYKSLANFVAVANLGWEEIAKGEFPLLSELSPDAHRALLDRIGRAFARRFRQLRPTADLPPLFLPNWHQWPRTLWPELYAYALTRRLFDSLNFLTSALQRGTPGAYFVPLSLQVGRAGKRASLSRFRDRFEEFLRELDACDLRRIKACPVCHRFFVAWRKDQKACGRRCANLFRIRKFRGNRSLLSSTATLSTD
jgi:hypothetical protein